MDRRHLTGFRQPPTDQAGIVTDDSGNTYVIEADGTRSLLPGGSGGGSIAFQFSGLVSTGEGASAFLTVPPGDWTITSASMWLSTDVQSELTATVQASDPVGVFDGTVVVVLVGDTGNVIEGTDLLAVEAGQIVQVVFATDGGIDQAEYAVIVVAARA